MLFLRDTASVHNNFLLSVRFDYVLCKKKGYKHLSWKSNAFIGIDMKMHVKAFLFQPLDGKNNFIQAVFRKLGYFVNKWNMFRSQMIDEWLIIIHAGIYPYVRPRLWDIGGNLLPCLEDFMIEWLLNHKLLFVERVLTNEILTLMWRFDGR